MFSRLGIFAHHFHHVNYPKRFYSLQSFCEFLSGVSCFMEKFSLFKSTKSGKFHSKKTQVKHTWYLSIVFRGQARSPVCDYCRYYRVIFCFCHPLGWGVKPRVLTSESYHHESTYHRNLGNFKPIKIPLFRAG